MQATNMPMCQYGFLERSYLIGLWSATVIKSMAFEIGILGLNPGSMIYWPYDLYQINISKPQFLHL